MYVKYLKRKIASGFAIRIFALNYVPCTTVKRFVSSATIYKAGLTRDLSCIAMWPIVISS